MPHSEQLLLLDAGGKPIPQFFNPVADRFRPVTGADLGDGRYGMDIVPWGKTSGGLYVPIRVTDEGAQEVALNGSNMELFGPDEANRPAADAVPVGATYMAVNTQEVWQSNGTEWKVI